MKIFGFSLGGISGAGGRSIMNQHAGDAAPSDTSALGCRFASLPSLPVETLVGTALIGRARYARIIEISAPRGARFPLATALLPNGTCKR